MKVKVENLTDTKVKLKVVLGVEELAIAEQVAVVKLSRDIQVAGFRKGKVPASVAIKNIDPNKLQEQAVNEAISKAVATAFVDENLQPLDRPEVTMQKFVPGEVLEFSAEVEILPKVTLGDYKKLKVTVDKLTVSDKEIDDVIDRIRNNLAEHKNVKRVAQKGDEVVIDFTGKRDGKVFKGGEANDYHLNLGSGQFIDGFEDGVIGHKAGDKFDLNLKFPKEYHEKSLAGKPVVFSVNLKSISEVVLPDIDDKFAAKVGPFKTVKEMQTDIKSQIQKQKKVENTEKLKDDLVKQLVAISKVPVPEILLKDQAQSLEKDFINNLAYQGTSLDNYLQTNGFKSREDWLETEVKELARKRVQGGLVLAELSKAEKIQASTDELETTINSYRQQYANSPDALKQFDTPEVRNNIANRLITDKTINRLLELNTKK